MGDVGATIKRVNRKQVEGLTFKDGKKGAAAAVLGSQIFRETRSEQEERAQSLESAKITGGLEEQVAAEKKKAGLLTEQEKKKKQGRRSTILTGGRGLLGVFKGLKKTLGA